MTTLPFKIEAIERHTLPALERKGCVAQALSGDFVVIKFFQTKTIIETEAGLPVMGLDKAIYSCVPFHKIENTIVIGCVDRRKHVRLVDMVMLGGKSLRGKIWRERLDALDILWNGFTSEGKVVFPKAESWRYGLMRKHKTVKEEGGRGLLIRVPGQTKVLFCC